MACFSTSPFLWLCGNNAFPSCSHGCWTSGLFPAFGYCDRRCWALVFKYLLDFFFPMFEHTPRSTLPSHARLLFQVSSPLCKQTVISPLPLDPPFTPPNILPKVPTHSWVGRCATILWLAACVCSSMLSAVLRFNMVGAGSLMYVSHLVSGFKTCVSLISFFLALVFICSCFYHFFKKGF